MKRFAQTAAVITTIALAGCGGGDGEKDRDGAAGVSGSIEADGSSTVFPITEAVAEEFGTETGGRVRVTVAMSGTGGGFKRFCAGETDISNASRPIKPEEVENCRLAGVEAVELPVAWDGQVIVVNPANTFAQCLTTAELKRIWEPGSTVQRWSDIRPEWPAQAIKLYGPGTNSGTFDYFTKTIMGEEDASRSDYSASEDDNVLVQGVAGDRSALGYFGYVYYVQNRDKLRALGVDSGQGCVSPTTETIASGTYSPLSHPLYIYVKKSSLQRPEVRQFVEFYLTNGAELAQQVGYVPFAAEKQQETRRVYEQAAGVNAPS
ncbi:MAG TPA: PstS family phosphate ABC transporter substrate-binding protein [Longimicrobiaceae bacterium]|nr:PstS family phosphate ABC transporter substrate-binding protein [Longimicrobiaceae bacterium]